MPASFQPPISPGGNANLVNRLRADTVKYGALPRLAWNCLVTAKMLALLPSAQSLAIVIGGTASDGDYVITFSGGGLAAPVPVTATRDAGQTSAQMAALLEAEIETARAGDLAGVVTGESVASATITVAALTKQPNVAPLQVAFTFPGSATGSVTYTYTTEIEPGTRMGGSLEKVTEMYEGDGGLIRGHATVNRRVAFAGATSVTAIMGDDNDDNGLLTSTSLASTGIVQTTGAAEFVPRRESTFVPRVAIVLASATPLSNQSLTAGEAVFEIQYRPIM